MEVIEIKAYSFSELSEEAKKRAIEWFRCLTRESGVTSYEITEHLKEELRLHGFGGLDLEWSLSCCQGDGVAFYGPVSLEDMANAINVSEEHKKWLLRCDRFVKKLQEYGRYPQFRVERNSYGYHYSHYNTMSVRMDVEQYMLRADGEFNLVGRILEKIRSTIAEEVVSVSKELEASGYDMIEHLESDETLSEHLLDRDDLFTENGSTSVHL